MDVKLIDGTQFQVRKPEYVLVSFPNQSYSKDALYLRFDDQTHFEKVQPILEITLSQTQMSRVLEYIEYLKATPENEEIKNLKCEEIGVNSIYSNLTEYVLNQYFNHKNPKIHYIVNGINEFPSFILRNVKDVDDCMHVTGFSANWKWFYIILVGETLAREEDYDINWKNLCSKVSTKQLDLFRLYIRRIRNGLTKTDNILLTDNVDDIEERLRKIKQYIRV